MHWRHRLIQVGIILVIVVLVTVILQDASAHGTLPQATALLSLVLPLVLLGLGLAALWLASSRRTSLRLRTQGAGPVRTQGLTLLGLAAVLLAILFLAQSIVMRR
jgi:membrane protease YdiL (CAAX protease family)